MIKKKFENQNTEFKESWRDDYLKVICGFANAKGGQLYIGIDDSGTPKGVKKDTDKLLEDIPNKIKNILGVVPSVEIKKQKGKDIIVVNIPAYESPISCGGKVYLRSGSTTQELNGPELERFLLKKNNRSWESVLEENATLDDIDDFALEQLKKKSKEKRANVANEGDKKQLLSKLHLMDKNQITRAAILLFGKEPQRFYPGAFIKIGRFSEHEEPISSDEIRGNLFDQTEKTMEILKSKYLTSEMRIQGLYRSDNLEFPELALREAIVNAIAHKDYSGTHTHIKVYADRLVFWNPGGLHHDLTIDQLKKQHASHPRNRLIAQEFFFCGLIESWGSGTMKMTRECVKANLPEPMFEEISNGLQVTFPKDIYTEPQLVKIGLNKRQVAAVLYLKKYGSINNQIYQDVTETEKRTATRDLSFLVESRIIERFGSTGKGTSYRLIGVQKKSLNVEGNVSLIDELDLKLKELDRELEVFDPNEDIKHQFNSQLFLELFDSWFSELLHGFIPIIQKFNRYFVNPRHFISLPQPLGGTQFAVENPEEVTQNLKKQILENLNRLQTYEATSSISTSYGSFKKGGLDTFGCNYSIEIKFSQDWYEIFMDDEVMKKNKRLHIKRQYHKPVTTAEIKSLAGIFGETIFQHITQSVDKLKQKNAKGS